MSSRTDPRVIARALLVEVETRLDDFILDPNIANRTYKDAAVLALLDLIELDQTRGLSDARRAAEHDRIVNGLVLQYLGLGLAKQLAKELAKGEA